MAERNRAAVRIDARIVVCDTEHPQHHEGLRRERFVQLDRVELIDSHVQAFEQLPGRGRRADAHQPWLDTRRCDTQHAGFRRHTEALRRRFIRE